MARKNTLMDSECGFLRDEHHVTVRKPKFRVSNDIDMTLWHGAETERSDGNRGLTFVPGTFGRTILGLAV